MAYKLAAKNDNDFKELLLAGQYGRQGLNCTKLYEDCNLNEKTFIEFAQLMPWSPVGELKHLKKLVSWVWNRWSDIFVSITFIHTRQINVWYVINYSRSSNTNVRSLR